jgi:hypothetical protein
LVLPYILVELFLAEVTDMDLFWSGLAQRASEHTWNERRSQFSKIHETAIQRVEMEKRTRIIVSIASPA